MIQKNHTVISIDAEKIQKFINDKKQNGILKTKIEPAAKIILNGDLLRNFILRL